MDIATLIGLFLGFGAVIGGQVLEGGHITALIQPTAALIVLGGTCGATCVSFPLQDVRQAMQDARKALFPPEEDLEHLIRRLIGFSVKARRDGLLALERDLQLIRGNPDDHFLAQGVELLVDGVDVQEFREIMEIDLATFEERNKASAELFEAAGGFAPTIGIIGAVLGLIHVMNNLADTASLGKGIAVAFVATIYGLMTANIICIPLGTKLKKRLKEQMLQREIIIDGLLAIQRGENHRMIEKRLRGFLPGGMSSAPPSESGGGV
ncbi:MAG: flagellar motor protein [Thermodesulfobacteriota bacterium]